MPIHDQGYRRYDGRRRAHGRTWWVIARSQISAALRVRRFTWLLIFSWVPFVVRVGQLYISSNFKQATFLAVTPETFRQFIEQQSIFVFLVTIALAGAIADDRRANALQVYLSKPLTRVEYVAGKLIAFLAFLLGVTFVPAVLLLVMQVLFAGSTAFLRANLFLLPAITLYTLIQALVAGLAMLALSSLSKSRRFVSILYAGIIFFTAAMYHALEAITGSPLWAAISPGDVLDVLADAIFRVKTTPVVPVWTALALVAVFVGVSIWVLERRIRGIEVVT